RLYLADEALLARGRGLAPLALAALAERLAGNMKTHVAYLARRPGTVARLDSPAWVPRLLDIDARALADSLARKQAISGTVEGLEITLPVPPLAAALAGEIDGRRSFAEILAALRDRRPEIEERAFAAAAQALGGALGGLNKLLLRRAGA
ncbi:MAG: methyltransferase, partial [Tistlia sp.]